MHIVAIGWMYVVLMMSLAEDNVVAALMTFLFYGVVPVGLILYISGSRRRRARNQAKAQAQAAPAKANTAAEKGASGVANPDQ